MRVLVTSFMRLNSERVPAKLLETLGESSLAEIMLRKLLKLKQQFGETIDVALAACPRDAALVDLAQRLSCPLLERSVVSRDGETYQEIYGELRDRLRHEYQRLVCVNPCQPFLRGPTIAAFVGQELDTQQQLSGSRAAVFRARGWVFDQNFQLINGDNTPNTKYNSPYYTLSASMFSYPTAALGTPAQMDFRHFVQYLPGPEFLDIDTPDDLEFARCYARGLAAGSTADGKARS